MSPNQREIDCTDSYLAHGDPRAEGPDMGGVSFCGHSAVVLMVVVVVT